MEQQPQLRLSEDGESLLNAAGEVVGVKQESTEDAPYFATPGLHATAARKKKKIEICVKWDKNEVCISWKYAYVDDDTSLA